MSVNFLALVVSGVLGGPTFTLGALCRYTPPLGNFFYTQSEYFTISNGIFNFNFLALVVFEILEVSQIYIRRPLYPRTKFYTPVEHFTISNVVFNFNFLTLVVSEMFGPKFT